MRESIIFYRSFYEGISALPKKNQLEVYDAIFRYTFKNEEPELSPLSKALFAVIKPQLDANNERYENGKKGAGFGKLGGRPKKETPMGLSESDNSKTPVGLSVKTPNENVNVNVNENVNVKEKSIKEKFHTPTVEEVKKYIEEKQYSVDAQRFVNFYESKGWMVGKNHMKDWKAAVRTWNGSEPRVVRPKYSAADESEATAEQIASVNEMMKEIAG